MNSPERFFFCHLQKTGGTSLQMALRKQVGPRHVYPLPKDRKDVRSQIEVEFLQDVWARDHGRLRIVTGHFPLCVTEVLGVPFRTFTLLREPVARTLSFLRHRVRLRPELEGVPLGDVYGEPRVLHSLIENHQVKMLSLTVDEMTAGAMTMTAFHEGHLERAIAALDRMDVVGLQTDLAGFYRALDERFGWSLGAPIRANVTADRTDPGAGEAADEELIARIRRDNALDIALYEHAVELVAARAAAATSSGADGRAIVVGRTAQSVP